MNLRLLLLILFSFFMLNSFSQKGKELDNKQADSMMPIVNGIYETIKKLESENVEIVRIEFDRIIETKISKRRFVEGYTYGVMVYGDYKVKGINVEILQKEGNKHKVIAKGENKGSSSIVHFEPPKTDEYQIKIKISEYDKNYSGCHYGLIIIHD